MPTPLSRRVARVAYYIRNIARDAVPQALFRARLDGLLRDAATYDGDALRRRLEYYNKLTSARLAPDGATVGSLPMGHSMYYYDLKEHARYFPRSLRLDTCFGDVIHVPQTPSFVKSRPIAGDNRNSVLMKMDKFRHFYMPPDPLPYADKKPMAVWRGGSHNRKRQALLKAYHDHPLCDVGQTDSGGPTPPKPFLTPQQQMGYKFVLSVEGIDVATNLKWILASNALCLMPAPLYETWFMEGTLQPGVHYVELRDDFADLEERIRHYLAHEDEALEIIRNANSFAAQFRDARREQLLGLLVVQKYFIATGQLGAPSPAAARLRKA